MRRKRLFSLLAMLTLLISLTVAIPIVHGDGGDGPQDFTVPDKQEQAYPNLGSHLNQLVASVASGERTAQQAAANSPIHSGGSVAVTIYLSGHVDEVVQFLEDNGGDPRNTGEDYIEAYVPVTLLAQLSQQPGVTRVREITPPQPMHGNVTSQGVQTHLAPAWHTAGYRGQGVKVGIIDSGFEGFSDLVGTELTAVAGVRCYSDIGVFSTSLADCHNPNVDGDVHGTAVAETITDIAPAASLYIADPYSQGDMQAIVDWMISQGVSVINMSLGWFFNGPGDGTSPYSWSVLKTVDRAVNGGILWANSAGNSARETWFIQESYTDSDSDGVIEFASGDEVNVIPYQMEAGQRIVAQLRWEDSWGGASSDFNLYLARWNATSQQWVTVDRSIDPQTGGSDHIPFEAVVYDVPADGIYGFAVDHDSGSVPDWIQLVSWEWLQHYSVSGSITNPAESANAGLLAVGATHYWDTNTIASYSSQGPAPDGRVKPDITGTACGAVASYEPISNLAGTITCWFSGTSQASPHVAAMAALVKQRFPSYTPAQIANYLKYNAEQRNAPPDPNNTWGHGFALLPPPTCAETVTADGTFNSLWGSGCDSQARSGSHARYYTFELAQQSEVTVTLASDNADTFLYLRQGEAKSGTALHENDDHNGSRSQSQIQETLAAGKYTIEATTYNASATGGFTLTIGGLSGGGGGTPPPSGDDCTDTITADGTSNGSWASGCDSEERSGSYARYYQFTLSQSSEVTVTLESSDADTFLYLRQGETKSGTALHEDDDGGTGTNSRIQATLAAGTYTVEATTFAAGQTGAFTLAISGLAGSTTPPPSADCDAQAITADGTVSGTWAAGCDSVDKAGSHARYYTFTLAQASDVTIGLESSVDTYLYLREGESKSGTALHENDDGGEGTNSRIQADGLAAGTYTIEATTYRAGETGAFTLTVSGLGGSTTPPPSGDCDAQAITADGTVSGAWAAGCDSVDKAGSHARYYTFTLAQASDVTIGLESSVDTYLYLRQGEAKSGTALHENDDGGEGTNSRIQADGLAAGTYTIEATTYRAGGTGSFTLTITGLGGGTGPAPDDCGDTITADGPVSGTWAAGCDSDTRSGSHARYYTFTLTQASDVTIDLESSVDTYLYLREGEAKSGTALHEDDDGGTGTNSRIQETLAAGTYTIEATTYHAAQTGSFTLTVAGLSGGGAAGG